MPVAKCPDSCKLKLDTLEGKIDGHHLTLYDKDGRGGLTAGYESLKSCMGKFITRKGGIVTTLAILTILAVLGVYGLTAWGIEKDRRVTNTLEIQDGKFEHDSNVEMLKSTDKRLTNIETNVETIRFNQEKLMMKQIEPEAMMKMIEKAVKRGNEP